MKKDEHILSEDRALEIQWDKTFPPLDTVRQQKVLFPTQFGLTLAADCYDPAQVPPEEKRPAVIVFGPFGTVKEQQAGFCAQALAARGLRALAPDPSFLGESGGRPKFMAAPDVNTEDIRAAVDFALTRPNVDADRVTVLGLGGWGSLALQAAALDTRIACVVTVAMQDVGRLVTNGWFDDENDPDVRERTKRDLNVLRTQDARRKRITRTENDPQNSPLIPSPGELTFYQTVQGFHKNAPNSLHGWNMTGCMSYLYHSLTPYLPAVRCPVLMLRGDVGARRYFTQEAFALLPKSKKNVQRALPGVSDEALLCAPQKIPFDEITAFLSHRLRRSSLQKRRTYVSEDATPKGIAALDFTAGNAGETPRLVAAILGADSLSPDDAPAARQYRLLVLTIGTSDGDALRKTLRPLLDEGLKGRELLVVTVADNVARSQKTAQTAAETVRALFPYCDVRGSACVEKNGSVDELIHALALLLHEASAQPEQ